MRSFIESLLRAASGFSSLTLGPTAENRLALLELAATGTLSREIQLSGSILPLDPKRLRAAAQAPGLSQLAIFYLLRLQNAIERQFNAPFSASLFLAAVDTIPAPASRALIDLQRTDVATLRTLLRGANREFRDPCRFALLEAYPSPSDAKELAEVVTAAIGREFAHVPDEASESTHAPSLEHVLITTVEAVDRVGALGKLLHLVLQEQRRAPKARAVLRAYKRWDNAVNGVIIGASASHHLSGRSARSSGGTVKVRRGPSHEGIARHNDPSQRHRRNHRIP